METEFNPNLCQKNNLFFPPYCFKNVRVPQILTRFLPATMRLLFADCCPVQRACLLGSFPPCSHPSLWHPLTPGQQFKEGSLLGLGISLGPGTSCQLCYLSPQSIMDREITITSLYQGTLQSGSIRQDKITKGGKVLNQAAEGFALVATQQEKCFLSPKLFFLLF